jgi:copper chaperone
MTQREFKISGMTCHHCVMAVKKELEKIQALDVKDVRVGTVQVAYDESKVDPGRIREAVAEAGYSVVG